MGRTDERSRRARRVSWRMGALALIGCVLSVAASATPLVAPERAPVRPDGVADPVDDSQDRPLDVPAVPQQRSGDDGPAVAAVIRGLDKVTARVREYVLPVGTPLRMGNLLVTVEACHSRPPEEPPESTAFVQITEYPVDGEPTQIFSGWMFASSPALNPLEHPVYDVWVMNCRALSPEQSGSNR